jgi:toluene monooxygenase system protein E
MSQCSSGTSNTSKAPLACSSWENFRDPRETTYTRYTELQIEKEIFVSCILDEMEANGYDHELQPQWVQTLAMLVAPFRYPGHALMMIAAYVAQMALGGRIVVAGIFQAGDEARRVERLAYRARQVQLAFPGFAADSKSLWEQDPCWQPLRQFVERLLITFDWGEAFVALNLVLKPMIDDLFLKHTSDLALSHNDHLLGQIFYSLSEDCQWHRPWSQALTQTAIEDTPANRHVIQTWINKWYPGALRAVDAFSSLFEGKPAGLGSPPFHDLTSRIVAFSSDYLRTMGLQPASNEIDRRQNDRCSISIRP